MVPDEAEAELIIWIGSICRSDTRDVFCAGIELAGEIGRLREAAAILVGLRGAEILLVVLATLFLPDLHSSSTRPVVLSKARHQLSLIVSALGTVIDAFSIA